MKHLNNKKHIARILIPVLVVGLGLWYYFAYVGVGSITLKGVTETNLYSHVAEVQGKIVEDPIELGQMVKKGDVLMRIDSTDMEYALEQLELTLVQKQAVLDSLEGGTEQEQIRQAQNGVSVAKATYEKARSDYQNTLDLYQGGGTSKTALDTIQYQMDVAKAQLDTADQQLQLLRSGAGDEAIVAADAAVAQIESQIAQTKEHLEKLTIKAACDGTVMSKNYNKGDLVATGYDLVDVAADGEIYLLCYLPVEYVSKVEYGQTLTVTYEGEEVQGTVMYVDVKSEYTPKDFQTSANKNRDSVKLKVKLPANVEIKPGEKADVRIPRT